MSSKVHKSGTFNLHTLFYTIILKILVITFSSFTRIYLLFFYLSSSHSFSLSSCLICFSGSIKVFVSFRKSLTKLSSSLIANFLQIKEINFSKVSQNLFIILCKWLFFLICEFYVLIHEYIIFIYRLYITKNKK